MKHADEREFSYGEMAIVICAHILKHGSISPAEAREITGGSPHQMTRLFRCLDRALNVYYEERGRRVLVEDDN